MHPLLGATYEGVARLARALSAVAPSSGGKLATSFSARHGTIERFEAFERETARPLLWMHAPSVGEGLQARPVLDLLSARRPDVQRAYTYFSPSARAFAATLDVDVAGMLPFDARRDMQRLVRALAPSALVFSKLDVWPTLAREAARAGTPLGLISATLAATSSRRSGIAGALLRDAYARLDRVGAISGDDADRLIALGVPRTRISVTGDTRYDQVWERARQVDRASPLLAALASDRPTLVAGSTWPSDERVLLPAWDALLRRLPSSRLVVAPHEPSTGHVEQIERWAAASGHSLARLGSPLVGDPDVVLVDRLGVLGDLYALADIAFVGGAFHGAGLHSVLEPAAFGVPVLFGPRYLASRDAQRLLDSDAAVSISDARALETQLHEWLTSDMARRAAGAAARAQVHAGLGAAERSLRLVLDLLGEPQPTPPAGEAR